jgi:hypothetical protein
MRGEFQVVDRNIDEMAAALEIKQPEPIEHGALLEMLGFHLQAK